MSSNKIYNPVGKGAVKSVQVTRQDIRSMAPEMQQRVIAAIKKMMELPKGQGASIFAELAGYHGWPKGYCAHGIVSFPAWHRAYLSTFEAAMQEADKQNGNNGLIGLPYWDWTVTYGDELFPSVIATAFPNGPLPKDLSPKGAPRDIVSKGYKINSNTYIKSQVAKNRLADLAINQVSMEPQFWQYASTSNTEGDSLEDPHNMIHGICGYPMSVVSTAAYHPIFWMHHCQIDRMLESYLQRNPDSKSEYKTDASYKSKLDPFVHRFTGKPWMPTMMFDIKSLGYKYESLMPDPQEAIREPPVVAAWKGVDLAIKLAGKTFTLFVFVLPLSSAEGWVPPPTPDEAIDAEYYAGSVVVLGGRGEGCDNCKVNRRPVNLTVDVTQALRDLSLKMNQVSVKVAACDGFNDMVPFEDTGLDQPKLYGPSFDINGDLIFESASEQASDNLPAIIQVQKRLVQLGYKLVADGVVGVRTKNALKSLQLLLGVEEEGGVVGAKTLDALSRTRHDGFADDEEDVDDKIEFNKGQKVRYWVGESPGYLSRERVLKEIDDALQAWSTHISIDFTLVEVKGRSDLIIEWSDHSPRHETNFGNERGGALAFTAPGQSITLDISEIWQLQDDAPREVMARGHKWPTFYLYPIVLHEIGHAIGLHHSMKKEDVMLPFYDAKAVELSANDIGRAVALYGRNSAEKPRGWFSGCFGGGSSGKVAPGTVV